MPDEPIDILAIVAHPDDAELFVGGTLALAAKRGVRTGIIDLTRGEMATRGTAETRAEEAERAAGILGLAHRENLDLGDAYLENDDESRTRVVGAIRESRPTLVITNGVDGRHPDHRRAHELVRDAVFLANVGEFPTEGERWKVEALAWWPVAAFQPDPRADWVVDIGETWGTKIAALEAFASQVKAAPDDPKMTYISSPGFWEMIERRAKAWGHMIGAEYGEPFVFDRPASGRHPLIELLR